MTTAALSPAPRTPVRAYLASAALACAVLAAAVAGLKPTYVAAAVAGLLIFGATFRLLTSWRVMVGALLLCILFVPIGRYGLPINLPFQMEPYRFLLLIVALAWVASLLAESSSIKFASTGLSGPMLAIVGSIVLSVVVNLGSIHARGLSTDVLFKLSFFASFFILSLLLASLLRTAADVDFAVKILVGGAAVVAFFTLVENKTGFNVFDHLQQGFPLLRFDPSGMPTNLEVRGSGFRVYGSAQHPLALGAALVTVVPLGVYLGFRTQSRFWWGALALITIAALATVARTAVMMLMVEGVMLVCLKPAILRRIWWAIPPFLVVVNIAVPATLGTLKASFFPKGGLIAQQSTNPGGDASNRVSDLGPGLREASKTPFFGQGWGTRVPQRLDATKTRRILDDQWLGVLLEAGWVGVLAWLWFFGRNVRLLSGAALRDRSPRGWLYAGLAASILGFAVGMYTYDAFGFPQATLLMFVMVGLGIAARRLEEAPPVATTPARPSAVPRTAAVALAEPR